MSFNLRVVGHTIDKDAEAYIVRATKAFLAEINKWTHPDTPAVSEGSWEYHNGGPVESIPVDEEPKTEVNETPVEEPSKAEVVAGLDPSTDASVTTNDPPKEESNGAG